VHDFGAIAALEPPHGEMTARDILEGSMKARLTAAPPTAPTTATVCAAIFWDTTTPKREAICVRKRTRNGAPSRIAPLSNALGLGGAFVRAHTAETSG
jgi:hypothetical protein